VTMVHNRAITKGVSLANRVGAATPCGYPVQQSPQRRPWLYEPRPPPLLLWAAPPVLRNMLAGREPEPSRSARDRQPGGEAADDTPAVPAHAQRLGRGLQPDVEP